MIALDKHGNLAPLGVPATWEWQGGANANLPSWLTTYAPAASQGGLGPVYQDDFSTDSATVIGSLSPDVGDPYTEAPENADAWSVTGGKLTRTAAQFGARAPLRAKLKPRAGSNLTFTGKVFVPSGVVSGSVTEILIASGSETVGRVGIEIDRANGSAYIKQYFNGAASTLATFTAGTYQGVEIGFTLGLSGTTVTATLNGVTATATLTQANTDLLANDTKVVLRSQSQGTTFDDLLVEAERPAGVVSPTFGSVLAPEGIYRHFMRANTGGTSWGEFRFGQPLDLTRFRAVQMRVDYKMDVPRMKNITFGFANDGRTAGVEWGYMNSTKEYGYFGAYGASKKYLATYMPPAYVAWNVKFHTATLTLDCKDGTVYVGHSDGQVNDVWPSAPITMGLVTPRIYLGNAGDGAQSQNVDLYSVKITAWR